MKNSFLSAIFFFFIQALASQNFPLDESQDPCCTPSNIWTEAYSNAFSPGMYSLKFTFNETPVILNANAFYEILSTDKFESEPKEQTGFFIRASGKRVYQYRFGQERLLYDYDAAVGDTFYTLHDAGLVVTNVDSIVLINGETRRRLTLECTQIEDYPIYWIDGIGSTLGFTQTSTCQSDWYTILLCAYQESVNIYRNPEVNSCWVFTTSTVEEKHNTPLIHPNPFDDHILIQVDPESITSIVLLDLLGRTVYRGKDVYLNTGYILPGIYVLSVSDKHGFATSKVMTKW